MRTNRAEWHGVAEADDGSAAPRKAQVTFRFEKDCYTLTGILLTQAALSILSTEDSEAKRMGGGILTPSTVTTEGFWKGLEGSGVFVETKAVE